MKIAYDGGTVTGIVRGGAGPVGVLLAHGAGAGQDHPWMPTVPDGLATEGLRGMLSVVGPTRMHYGRNVAMVRYMSTLMEEMLGVYFA